MLTGQGSKEDLQRLPRQGQQCRQALVPTGVLRGICMPDTRVITSDPEPTLDDVGREFPAWHCYASGINGLVLARLRDSSPLVIVRGEDPVDLRDEIRRWTAC
jgi:hypothetical protein